MLGTVGAVDGLRRFSYLVWRNGGRVGCELGCEQIKKRRHLDRGTNLNKGIRGNREEQDLLRTAVVRSRERSLERFPWKRDRGKEQRS